MSTEKRKHTKTNKKRHLWISSSSDNNVRSKPESNIRYSTDRKGSETKKQPSLQLYSIHTAKCLLLMFSLTMALKPETVHEKWHYILKKTSSSVKTAISFKQIESPVLLLLLFKIIQSAISHQQREPVIKIVVFPSFSFFLFLRFLFLVNSDWNQFVFKTCE